MDKMTQKKLELDKIIGMLIGNCLSDKGREIAEKLEPMTHSLHVNNALDETCEAESFILSFGHSPMRMFDDISGVCKRAKIGGIIQCMNLLSIASFLGVSREVKHSILNHESELPIIKSHAQLLVLERFLENEIKRCILGEDELSDSASPQLYKIRREMKAKQSQIRDKLESMLRSSSKYLQESIITIRNGRYVVPVKAEFKPNVPGLVHDISSSGSTVFVEPMAAVELNNAVKTLQAKEKIEIDNILRDLSMQVSQHADNINVAYETLAQLDFIFAKGALSIDMEAIRPRIQEDFYVKIVKGRHPLIKKDEVVPIDLWIGKEFKCLIITGPNTGGKTVTLKTIGLFSLMTQCGLLLPASAGTCMPIFKDVYADIGDEQSIEQSLSTFSSHMTNIVKILEKADYEALVLLDELGAGTDPTEGAALGISILENLLALGTLTMATTHYSELKAFALSTDNVENAAMEFNVESLSPTYKMGIGIPGKSNAFEISRRLGLQEDIIKRSREHISGEGIRFEDVLSSAERNRKASIVLRKEAQQKEDDAKKLLKRAEDDVKKLKAKKAKEIEESHIKANQIIASAREEVDKVIKRMKEIEKTGGVNLDRERQIARDTLSSATAKNYFKKEQKVNNNVPSNLKLGQSVRLVDSDNIATVLSLPNAKGEVQVQAGILKLRTNIKNLEIAIQVNKSNVKYNSRGGIKTKAAPLELDIRGSDTEVGIMQLDIYLDNAFTSALPSVQIIHGKGSGVLRAAVHRHLRSHPHVKTFRLGKYGEGESGVTIVKIK